jgi:hypothetical protein
MRYSLTVPTGPRMFSSGTGGSFPADGRFGASSKWALHQQSLIWSVYGLLVSAPFAVQAV